jgi:hypothetical protein
VKAKAVLRFLAGRTHRSNQANAPEYVFLISDLAGEKRFASVVAKRLESLGALTHGDRRSAESRDLSRFNIDTKWGRVALESVRNAIMGETALPVVPEPREGFFKGTFPCFLCQYSYDLNFVFVAFSLHTELNSMPPQRRTTPPTSGC